MCFRRIAGSPGDFPEVEAYIDDPKAACSAYVKELQTRASSEKLYRRAWQLIKINESHDPNVWHEYLRRHALFPNPGTEVLMPVDDGAIDRDGSQQDLVHNIRPGEPSDPKVEEAALSILASYLAAGRHISAVKALRRLLFSTRLQTMFRVVFLLALVGSTSFLAAGLRDAQARVDELRVSTSVTLASGLAEVTRQGDALVEDVSALLDNSTQQIASALQELTDAIEIARRTVNETIESTQSRVNAVVLDSEATLQTAVLELQRTLNATTNRTEIQVNEFLETSANQAAAIRDTAINIIPDLLEGAAVVASVVAEFHNTTLNETLTSISGTVQQLLVSQQSVNDSLQSLASNVVAQGVQLDSLNASGIVRDARVDQLQEDFVDALNSTLPASGALAAQLLVPQDFPTVQDAFEHLTENFLSFGGTVDVVLAPGVHFVNSTVSLRSPASMVRLRSETGVNAQDTIVELTCDSKGIMFYSGHFEVLGLTLRQPCQAVDGTFGVVWWRTSTGSIRDSSVSGTNLPLLSLEGSTVTVEDSNVTDADARALFTDLGGTFVLRGRLELSAKPAATSTVAMVAGAWSSVFGNSGVTVVFRDWDSTASGGAAGRVNLRDPGEVSAGLLTCPGTTSTPESGSVPPSTFILEGITGTGCPFS